MLSLGFQQVTQIIAAAQWLCVPAIAFPASADPRAWAVVASILIAGIIGNLALKDGLLPFSIPEVFPKGIPAIVFAAIAGILMSAVFLLLTPSLFGAKERKNINC